MAKAVSIMGALVVLLLLSGCGEQLVSEAKKFAEQVAAEANKTAVKKIDELRNDTVEQLKQMRGEGSKEQAVEKTANKPAETADSKAAPKSDW